MSNSLNPKPDELLRTWQRGLRLMHIGHFRAANRYQSLHRKFGIPVIVATCLVGSAIFATAGRSDQQAMQITAGFVSLAATILASLQTFLGYADLSSRHKLAAVRYGELRREVEAILAAGAPDASTLKPQLDKIRAGWDSADKELPVLPKEEHDSAMKTINQGHSDGFAQSSQTPTS